MRRRIGTKSSANSFVGPITIDSISANSNGTSVTISFTHNFRGKNSLTYQASTTGLSSSVGTSPLTINGLTPGTSYAFTVVASSTAGVLSSSSTTSGSITIDQQPYSLSQTFLSSGVFTVPANVTEIAVKGIGAGGNGANGLGPDGGSGSAGGRGGGGGGGFIFKNYSVTPGQTYTVTVGSSGQATSFGSLATANSGTSSSGGTVSSTITLEASSSGPTGGAGGSGGSYSYSFGTPSAGQSGSNGSGGSTLTSTAPGVGSISLGGSGGGGGGGAVGSTNGGASGGLGGSGSGGGSGGNGGSASQPGSGGGINGGSNGTSSSSRGAGGGGGGGGSLSRDSGTGGGQTSAGGSGGSGQPGAIYVYTRIPATYSISPSTTSLNEGSSVTFNITTTNFGSGTLYWTLEGVSGTINNSDFSSPANAVTSGGSVSITNNSGSFAVTLSNDSSTEGTESFLARLRSGSTSGATVASSSTISVGDTSTTPPPPPPPPIIATPPPPPPPGCTVGQVCGEVYYSYGQSGCSCFEGCYRLQRYNSSCSCVNSGGLIC
jgi:hypothetical protein